MKKENSPSKFAVIIPTYNDGKTIRNMVERTLNQISHVVVVDDGSTDDTLQQLADLPVQLISNPVNRGKAQSLWRGFHHVLKSELDGVITLDGDGQHLPEDIPRLIAAYHEFPDSMIIGSRTHDIRAFPPLRRWANQLANWGIHVATKHRIPDSQSGFRLYPISLLRSLEAKSHRFKGFVFESEGIIEAIQLGFDIRSIPIAAVYGQELRKSHFHPARDTLQIGIKMLRKYLKTFF